MNKIVSILSIIIVVLILQACKNVPAENSLENISENIQKINTVNQEVSIPEYFRWVENKENGLIKRKEIGNYFFELQYKPTEYVTLQMLQDEKFDSLTFKKESENNSDMLYFTLRIGSIEGNDSPISSNMQESGEFFKRVEYLSFEIQKDFKLVEGRDTLSCLLNHFERTYELTPYNTFVLAFANPVEGGVPEKDLKFIYNDNVFGSGTVNFIIKSETINNVPKIKI